MSTLKGADHLCILVDQRYAPQVSAAIPDVTQAARTGEPLAQQ